REHLSVNGRKQFFHGCLLLQRDDRRSFRATRPKTVCKCSFPTGCSQCFPGIADSICPGRCSVPWARKSLACRFCLWQNHQAISIPARLAVSCCKSTVETSFPGVAK